MLKLHKSRWNSKFYCRNDHFTKKIWIEEYPAKFNTNISMLWLHKNDCSYNVSIKQGTIRIKFILENIRLNSALRFQCYDCIKTIDIPNFIVKMDTFRRKFLFAYTLLHSILIFSCCYYIKAIEFLNFIVKMKTFSRKFALWNTLIHSILIFQRYDCINTIDMQLNFQILV